jgi:hypothetical protein
VVAGSVWASADPIRTVSKNPNRCGKRQDGGGKKAKFDKRVVELFRVCF